MEQAETALVKDDAYDNGEDNGDDMCVLCELVTCRLTLSTLDFLYRNKHLFTDF